jgi:hypothetical protein
MMLSRTLRPTFAALLVLGLSGCSDDPLPPPLCIIVGDQFVPVDSPGIVLVGQPVSVTIPPSTNLCLDSTSRPTSVTAEIEGPGGEPLSHQIELRPQGDAAVLQFTPERSGPHHVLVAFAEVGGVRQFDFLAAQDRSAEAPAQPLSRMCGSLERTLQGAWICDAFVERGETILKEFSGASRLAVAGDVIWVVESTRIQRYVDTGTELLLTGTLTHPYGTTESVVASPDELVVLDDTSLVLYTFQAGVLSAGYPEPWARPVVEVMSLSPRGVLVRNGDWLAIGTRSKSATEPVVQVCLYQLLSGRFHRTSQACQQLPGEIHGFEPGVLWTKDLPSPSSNGLNMGLVRRWVLGQGRLDEQGSVSLGVNTVALTSSLRRPSAVPVVATSSLSVQALVTWSPQRKALVLESLDTQLLSASATPSLYWGQEDKTSRFKVRTRPSSSP